MAWFASDWFAYGKNVAFEQISLVGPLANAPTEVAGQPLPRSHAGHSGWTISQIDNILPSPALDGHPDIILLHVGTNDIWRMP